MSFQDIRDAREGFVRENIGDRLIKIESFVVGVIAFFVLAGYTEIGFLKSLIIGIVIAKVLPWLIGLLQTFAWVALILFSAIWAVLGYFFGGAILGDSPVAGAIVAIIIFIASVFMHKVFAGLGYSSVDKHIIDALDGTQDNTAQMSNQVETKYCIKCGSAIEANANFCNKCGSRQ